MHFIYAFRGKKYDVEPQNLILLNKKGADMKRYTPIKK